MNLINSASILHDIKRQEKNHDDLGAELLHSLGYYKIANIIRCHMKLNEEMGDIISETTILYYGDKLIVEDEFSDLDKRFKVKLNKYRNNKKIQENIMKKYETTLKVKSNIISIIGRNEYEKLEKKWRGKQ